MDAYHHAAFTGCTSLRYVEIPSSVNHIVCGAFKNTPYVSELYSDDRLAFATAYDDSSVHWLIGVNKSIRTLTVGMLSLITSIPDNAFNGCTRLNNFEMPSTIKSIGAKAFYGCTNLTEITIPSSVETIGAGAFAMCTGLTTLTIPNSVTEIGEWIIRGCKSLESLTLPFIGKKNYLSQSDLRLTECNDEYDGSHDEYGTIYWLFGSITDLDDDGMITVDCFDYCYVPESLVYLELLEGCHCVNYYALNDDNYAIQIETIILPSTITRIEEFAFYGNRNIITLKCKATSVPYLHEDAFGAANVDSIFVPAASVSAYQSNSTWSSVANIYAM